jgi:hypothetical protein
MYCIDASVLVNSFMEHEDHHEASNTGLNASTRDNEEMDERKEIEEYIEDERQSIGRFGRHGRGWKEDIEKISIQLYEQ